MTDKPFIITRTFNAPRELVFACFTESKHLKHWTGPTGSSVVHTDMDLRPGGSNHYALKTPDGSLMWGIQNFIEVEPPVKLVYTQSFFDENRGITTHPMAPTWPLVMHTIVNFDDLGDETKITLTWKTIDSATEVERQTFNFAHDGMTMGWGGSFDKLDEYLKTA